MIRKKVCAIILFSLFVISTTGCSLIPDGSVNDIENGKLEINEIKEDHIKGQLNENFIIDADVKTTSDNTKWKQLTAVKRDVTLEEAKSEAAFFSKGEEVGELAGSPMYNRMMYVYNYKDGSNFLDNGGSIQFSTDKVGKKKVLSCVTGNESGYWQDKNETFPLQQLNDLSLDDAKIQIRQVCDKFGIALSDAEPEVFVMDAESMTKLINANENLQYYKPKDDANPDTWTEVTWNREDEMYFMTFYMSMDGEPLSDLQMGTDSKYSLGSKVMAAIGRDGIEYFDAQVLYTIKDRTELEGKICSVDDAVNVLASTYQYTDTAKTVTDIELVYVPLGTTTGTLTGDEEFLVRPYWNCTISYIKNMKEKDGSLVETNVQLSCIVDAASKVVYKSQPKTFKSLEV